MNSIRDLFSFGNRSIQRKLTLIIMAVTTVALLLISGAFATYELMALRQSLSRDISTTAEVIANQSTAALTYDDPATAVEILTSLGVKQHVVAAGIYKEGRLFAQFPREERGVRFPPNPQPCEPRFEANHLVFTHAIVLDGETIGAVYLKYDLSDFRIRLWRYGGIMMLFLFASFALALIVSRFLQTIITQPIMHLAATARAVSEEKNYSVRAVKRSGDELGQLMDGFNEMLTQIQEQDAALRQAHDKLEKRVEERTQDLQLEIVERERAQAGLREQLGRISLLNQITQVIAERQDLPSILQVVLRHLEERASVDLGGVFLFEPGRELLRVAALRGRQPEGITSLGLRAGDSLALEESGVARCRSAEAVEMRDTAALETGLARALNGAGLHSAVAAPMMVEGKLFGILLVSRRRKDAFAAAECEFFRVLSEHVALAAHQARLHTELETAYNELRQTQQAVMQQDRLRALGQMASGIAHDINNALSPVVGFAGLLMAYEPNLSQGAKKQLNYIKTAGEDVAHIVARLREFYRHRGDREALSLLDLNHVVGQVVEMTRPRWRDMAQEKGIVIGLFTELAPELPELPGVASEIREALTNLILNAVDAMPRGGRLTVRTRMIQAGVGGTMHAVLEVADTGVGMSETTRRHCLEPFYSTKGKRGTGMGLAMVYGVMERHEGTIEIESELGQGATIRLIFPLHTRLLTAGDQPSASGPASPLNILCIDDEPLLRELIKEMLEKEGHLAQTADGGQTGLDAFHLAVERGRPFDIVITDLGMPHLDGREVARTLKKFSPRIPVIMLTGWGAFMQTDSDMPLHVDGVLSKPPRAKELHAMLGRLAQKQPATA